MYKIEAVAASIFAKKREIHTQTTCRHIEIHQQTHKSCIISCQVHTTLLIISSYTKYLKIKDQTIKNLKIKNQNCKQQICYRNTVFKCNEYFDISYTLLLFLQTSAQHYSFWVQPFLQERVCSGSVISMIYFDYISSYLVYMIKISLEVTFYYQFNSDSIADTVTYNGLLA